MFSSPLVDFSVSSETVRGNLATKRISTITQVGSFGSGAASLLTSARPVTPEGSAFEA